MKVKVDEDCIRYGIKKSMKLCPVMLAIRKDVSSKNIRIKSISDKDRRNVIEFMLAFDAGSHVEPFEFECEIF